MSDAVARLLDDLRHIGGGHQICAVTVRGQQGSAVQLGVEKDVAGTQIVFHALGGPVLVAACEYWLRELNAALAAGTALPEPDPRAWQQALRVPREHLGEFLLVEDGWRQLLAAAPEWAKDVTL